MKQGKGKQEADASPLHPEPVEGWGEGWVRGGFIFMNEKQKKEYYTVILGALLHDVGKFYQRGLEKRKGEHQQLGDECFEEYFAEKLPNLLSQDEIGIVRSAINNHHGYEKFVTLADWLSAGMERIGLEDEEHGDPSRERLQSLFDHVKTTAAIAGCLYHCEKTGKSTDKEFLIVAGDISGIQNFIYRITKAQGEGGISKILRGRSFYLLLFQEVIAKYIIEQAGLFITNILFCGGGRFELLLPNTEETKKILEEVKRDVNKWLFDKHG